MRAARIVSELTLLFAIFPQFIEPQFRQAHERLHATKYIEHYTDRVGPSVQILPALLRFLPVDLLIGEDYEPGKTSTIPTTSLVMASDFVAGLTDTRARELHERHIESSSAG
jgi:dGTPase